MTRVMAVGVFDLLHPGHLHYLQQAADLGEELVVVVARDVSVEARKGFVVLPEEHRLRVLQALQMVDLAVLGDPEDHYRTVERMRPDIIALGHDDHHAEADVIARCADRGLTVDVQRCEALEEDIASSTRILQRVVEAYERGDLEQRLKGGGRA